MFSPNLMNDLIHAKLTKIAKLQNIIKKDDLRYKSKHGKFQESIQKLLFCKKYA